MTLSVRLHWWYQIPWWFAPYWMEVGPVVAWLYPLAIGAIKAKRQHSGRSLLALLPTVAKFFIYCAIFSCFVIWTFVLCQCFFEVNWYVIYVLNLLPKSSLFITLQTLHNPGILWPDTPRSTRTSGSSSRGETTWRVSATSSCTSTGALCPGRASRWIYSHFMNPANFTFISQASFTISFRTPAAGMNQFTKGDQSYF